MIIKLPDLSQEINSEVPFAKCALGRQPYAELLTEIVGKTEQGVISLNGGWGTGKTTFVRMWEIYLMNKGFTTLYFNVWDNDYTIDPMVSLMSQLYKLFKHEKKKKDLKTVLSTFGKIAINVGKPLGKGMMKKLTGVNVDEVIEGLEGASEEVVDEVANLGQKLLDRVSKEQCDIEAFKKALESVVKTSENNDSSESGIAKPIICFIDELDRCNPYYSVLVLERIKHIFSIPGIVFVLSVDKRQFGNAIRGYYGSDLIDANEYLRRFIDLDLNLPPISSEKFFEYLYNTFKFKDLFSKRNGDNIKTQCESFKLVGGLLLDRSNITLRQAEKMMGHIHIVLSSLSSNQYFTATTYAILIFLRNVNMELYENISKNNLTLQELIDSFENQFKNFFFVKHHNYTPIRAFIFSLAEIVCMYNTQEYGIKGEKIIDTDGSEKQLLIKTDLIPEEIFLEALLWEDRIFRFGTPPINSVIRQIELVGHIY